MNTLRGILQRISGRQHLPTPNGFEPQLLQRLYQRLVLAIASGDQDDLALLLASDSEWRRIDRQCVSGRVAVIAALLQEPRVGRRSGTIDLHLHGALGVAEALWSSVDLNNGQELSWIRSCIFALRRGYWQVVSVRDRAFAAADAGMQASASGQPA